MISSNRRGTSLQLEGNAPGLLFILWGGLLADRYNRKNIVLLCQSLQFLSIFTLFAFIVAGKIQIWMIFISSFLVGTTDALSMPAFQSIVPSLVNETEIPRAVALNSTWLGFSGPRLPAPPSRSVTPRPPDQSVSVRPVRRNGGGRPADGRPCCRW